AGIALAACHSSAPAASALPAQPVQPPAPGAPAPAAPSEPAATVPASPHDGTTSKSRACTRAEYDAPLAADLALASLEKLGAVDGKSPALAVELFSGTVYQRGSLAVGKHEALRVTATARVIEGSKPSVIEVFLAKQLAFAGH